MSAPASGQEVSRDTVAASAGVIFDDPEFIAALQEAAVAAGKTPDKAEKYARKCLKEIEATPKESWLRPVSKLARFIYTRSYEAELDINQEALEALREQSGDKLLLFLWSHKSHMDSFVFLLSLYENNFRLPLVFAGINMNFLGFGAMARRVGAIFLRRSFQDDPIYKLVFRSYIDYLIRNRVPLTWSIEGTRSRTGKLSPPKLGILNWVLESCAREQMDDVLLVPVSIAFDRIAEIDDYVAIQQGQPKRKESLRWFLDYIFGSSQPNGKIYVRYAPPISPGELTDPSWGMLADESEPEKQRVAGLALEVCSRIEQITPIKSADVLTLVLLGANRRALTTPEISRQTREIATLVQERRLPAASAFSLAGEEEVAGAVLALKATGLVDEHDKSGTPVYYIPRDKYLAAAYYRNTITHFFLAAALAEVGLAACALDISVPGEDALRKNVTDLTELYRFEFFFPPLPALLDDTSREAQARYPGWQSGEHSIQKLLRDKPPRFGHAILRSISESYLVIAVTLLELDTRPVDNQKKFLSPLQAQGEQMLLRRTISCNASISRDLLASGLRLAEHRQLLTGPAAVLRERREDFADQVVNALSAVNLLQRAYDEAWFSQLSAGKVSNLLGP
jgi:glycerol-3-phosphate O-acyltransferase